MAALRESWPDVVTRLSRVLRALRNSGIPSYADAMARQDYLTKTRPASAKKPGMLDRYVKTTGASLSDRAERLESPHQVDEQREIAVAFASDLPPEWLFEWPEGHDTLWLPETDEEEEESRLNRPLFHRILHDFLNLLRIARVIAGGPRDEDQETLAYRLKTGVAEAPHVPDKALPEITLTQRDGRLSGWISIGQLFGENYYYGVAEEELLPERVESDAAWNSAVQPVIRSLHQSFLAPPG